MHASPWPTPRQVHHSLWLQGERKYSLNIAQLHTAFPRELRTEIAQVRALIPPAVAEPIFWFPMRLGREALAAPSIVYNDPIAPADFQNLSEAQQAMALALYTSHHDGYIRADAVAQLVARQEPWIAPYLLLRLGDMVEQVIEPIAAVLNAGGPEAEALRRMLAESATLNPFVFRTVRSRAASYWHEYYTWEHPKRDGHPGISACKDIAAAVEPGALLKW